jgi:phosphoglycerate dehydrogenase-like enzyme
MNKDIRIIVASPISPDSIDLLETKYSVTRAINLPPGDFRRLLPGADVLVFRSGITLSAEVLRTAAKLRLIVRAGSGMDNIDLDFVKERGIIFERIPQPGARAVAELSFTFMLALARNLFMADSLLRKGRWAKYEIQGYLLNNKVLGIVGAGNIGAQVGRMGVAWGMDVLGCVKPRTPEIEKQLKDDGIQVVEFEEVMTRSDFVSVHVPLTPETRGLIGPEELNSMKPGSFLLNLARGGIVVESALHDVLKKGGGLAGAALDVHEKEGEGAISPLATLPNVILTPHIGAQTVDSQREIGERAVRIIDDFVKQT